MTNDIIQNIAPDFPLFFEWELTYACNSRCLHCYNNSGKKLPDELNKKETDAVVAELCEKKPVKVDFLGGEPLLHPRLFSIARKLKKSGITIGIITNGSLLSDEKIKKIKKLFSMVQISLDGKPNENARVRGSKTNFAEIIENIRKVNIALDGNAIVSTVLTKENTPRMKEFLGLLQEIGIKKLKVSPFIHSGRGLENAFLAPTKNETTTAANELKKQKAIEILFEPKINQLNEKLLPLNKNWLTLSANGYILPNTFVPFAIGNVRKNPISAYWKAGLRFGKELRLKDFGAQEQLSYKCLQYFDILDGKNKRICFTGGI